MKASTPAERAAGRLKPLTKSQVAKVSTLLTLSEQARIERARRQERESYRAAVRELEERERAS